MAESTIILWRDVPAQVTVKDGRRTAKRQLSARFQESVDKAAMVAGAHGNDAYLAEWRRSPPQPCGDDIEAEADAACARLEAEYDDARLLRLVRAGGREGG